MVHAEHTGAIQLRALGLQDGQVDEGKRMVLIVIGMESRHRVLVLGMGLEHAGGSGKHGFKGAGAVGDVPELLWPDARHDCSLTWKARLDSGTTPGATEERRKSDLSCFQQARESLDPSKVDLQRWREAVAERLRE